MIIKRGGVFGVEWCLIEEKYGVCYNIKGVEKGFLILSFIWM